MVKRILILLLVLSSALQVFSLDLHTEPSLEIFSARMAGMGGYHAALADDVSVLFSNPAGYRVPEPELSVAELTLNLTGPIFDMANLFLEGGDLLNNPDTYEIFDSLYSGIGLVGPIAVAFVGDGVGFGIYNQTSTIIRSPTATEFESTVREELLLTGGYSFRLPAFEGTIHTLDLGLSMKGFLRGEGGFTYSLLLINDFMDNLGPDLLLNEPYANITGIGFDLGLLYSYGDALSVGLVGQDVFSPTLRSSYTSMQDYLDGNDAIDKENGVLPFQLHAGLRYTPPLGPLSRYFSDVDLYFDYRNMFDFLFFPELATNPVLHLSFGAEFRMLEILSLRTGLYQGLLAAGLGVDLNFATLNMAMYGTEQSLEPGMQPVYNVILGLEFRY
ncbi:hypothetical protein B4O97_12845 [Marispirochaeta aestuarii]|uniref:DUF5723 domain-containing protein n=1 Tax=Marispirochaeta aestuarii TaxID=1963862 RepID=A0A1Y1RXW0_9SPIO|nr:hypothetical protein [Marispirochaeta aestuarii]ORC34522.1 hypothetical protein B4O97_12845 [Marispirochaeta aestuarii]